MGKPRQEPGAASHAHARKEREEMFLAVLRVLSSAACTRLDLVACSSASAVAYVRLWQGVGP